MTACGYYFIFVEYCSEKAMLYKIQSVNEQIVHRNLIVLSCAGGFRFVYTLVHMGQYQDST